MVIAGQEAIFSGFKKGAAALSPICAPKAIPRPFASRIFYASKRERERESYACDNNNAHYCAFVHVKKSANNHGVV